MKNKASRMSSVLAATCCASLLLTTPLLAEDLSDTAGQNIYRLYNENTGEHLYTSASDEKSTLVTAGWVFEGVGWVAPYEGEGVYRLYNPNADGGDHYYTTNLEEAKSLASLGWLTRIIHGFFHKTIFRVLSSECKQIFLD